MISVNTVFGLKTKKKPTNKNSQKFVDFSRE